MSTQAKRDSEGAIVVSRVASNAIQPATNVIVTPARKKPKKEAIDEDAYLETIDKIVQRDFFPDLPKLRTQLEWLEAEKNNDLQKMREIHVRLRSSQNQTSIRTPATFQTPQSFTPSTSLRSSNLFSASPFSTPAKSTSEPISSTQQTEQTIASDTTVRLDNFLSKYTSEDNDSFEKLMDKQNELKRQKYAYLANKEAETQLLLTDGNNNPQRSASVLTWNFTAKNALMYTKDGVGYTEQEERIIDAGPPKEIVLENTRIKPSIAPKPRDNTSSKDPTKIDLNEIRGLTNKDSGSPKVRGYGFIATPSPAPGVDASPFTTWGTIEGAPLLLDSTTFDLSGPIDGPTFRIPETSSRERIAHDLNDQITAKKKKEVNTPKRPTSNMATPSPHRVDMQLRASYSPKVSGVAQSPFKVPVGTPKRTPLKSAISSSPRIFVTPKAKESSKS